jgi:hypothetical protein
MCACVALVWCVWGWSRALAVVQDVAALYVVSGCSMHGREARASQESGPDVPSSADVKKQTGGKMNEDLGSKMVQVKNLFALAIFGEMSAIFGAIIRIAFWCRGTQKRRSPSINCLKGLSSATQAVIL